MPDFSLNLDLNSTSMARTKDRASPEIWLFQRLTDSVIAYLPLPTDRPHLEEAPCAS